MAARDAHSSVHNVGHLCLCRHGAVIASQHTQSLTRASCVSRDRDLGDDVQEEPSLMRRKVARLKVLQRPWGAAVDGLL
jgi:hypothetical protein